MSLVGVSVGAVVVILWRRLWSQGCTLASSGLGGCNIGVHHLTIAIDVSVVIVILQ